MCCSITRPRMADQSVVLQESKSTTGFQLPELDPVDTEDSNANGPDFSQRDSWLEQMPTMKCFASELKVRHPHLTDPKTVALFCGVACPSY